MAKPTREQMYFPIIMPLNAKGQGPCTIPEAVEIKFCVWDQTAANFGDYDYLSDAIDEANRLNEEYEKLLQN